MRFVSFLSNEFIFNGLVWKDSSSPSEERRVEEIHSISFRCPEKWNIKLLNIIMITYHCHLHARVCVCVRRAHTCILTLNSRLTSADKEAHEMRVLYRRHSKKLFIHLSAQQKRHSTIYTFSDASLRFCSIRIYLWKYFTLWFVGKSASQWRQQRRWRLSINLQSRLAKNAIIS